MPQGSCRLLDANPLVFGELRTPGATRTLIFYAHYDGQPVEPTEWATPPFEPVVRNRPLENGGAVVPLASAGPSIDPESRLYARSAADDKAAIVALMAAVDAIRAAGLKTRSHIKFVFEGEEEAGSANLEKMLAANRDLFSGDLWLVCDGPLYQTRQQSVIFGARGIATFDLTVYGPRAELHSGHYGNWAPNPALSLARLLSSMKDPETDRVLIEGFYDQVEPLTSLEKKAIADAPAVDAALMEEFWLGSTESRPRTLNELITRPSLNIRGMASARVGATATNIIPASATATLDVRLVKKMSVQRTLDVLRAHVRRAGVFRRRRRAERRGAAHPRASGQARVAAWRRSGADVDGPACIAAGDPHGGKRPGPGCCVANDGRPIAAGCDRAGDRVAHDRHPDWQPRQPPAQRQ